MNGKTSKLIILSLCLSFVLPNLVLASWWNPATWFVREVPSKFENVNTDIVHASKFTDSASSSPLGSDQSLLNDLQTQLEAARQVVDDKASVIKSLTATITNLQKSLVAANSLCKQGVEIPVAKPVQQSSNIPTSGSGGGSSGFYSSGPQLAIPLQCSDYTKYFASIPDCEYIREHSRSFEDGVEIDPPLYTLCKQCLPGDTSQPFISNIKAINITGTSVTIVWTTGELADSTVTYATATMSYEVNFPKITIAADQTEVINHSLDINNLSPNTVYYYTVQSIRTNGTGGLVSHEQSFTTLAN